MRPYSASVSAVVGACVGQVFAVLSVVPGFQLNQANRANIDFVPIGQRRRPYQLPVDVGAVEATDVDHMQFVILPPKLRVSAAHRDVV